MARYNIERRLERLVTATFTKAFRSGVQPIEVGRRIVRELESAAQVTVKATVVPNQIVVSLSPSDAERFATIDGTIATEFADAAREYALEYRYHFVGPVTVEFQTVPELRMGAFEVRCAFVEGDATWTAALRLPDGRRIALTNETIRIGRLPDCQVQLSDPKCSRNHAEIRPIGNSYMLHDLNSTNGTLLNNTVVIEAVLSDGDEVQIGASVMRYEES